MHKSHPKHPRRAATTLALAAAVALLLHVPASADAAPQIAIGSAAGAPGDKVTIAISLQKNGTAVNVIAPLEIAFDETRLAADGCVSAAPGKSSSINRSGGRLALALSGTEAEFPDGVIVNCTFSVLDGASGVVPLTFVRGGVADTAFNDHEASGSDGAVTVAPR